jgi:branched-subunit amino acid aminotransferase/4-amino-4-deoxychorismate lyase
MDVLEAFYDGRWISASELAIPVSDTGFVQGVCVAEQLRTFRGKLFRFDQHLERLFHCLDLVGIDPGMPRGQFAAVAEQLTAHNHRLMAEGDDLGLSIFVTPGPYRSFAGTQPARPLVCMHTYPLPFRLWAGIYQSGQALVTTAVRQVPGDCWPTELKCRSRMHYYLADREAASIEPGARALLLDHEGFVTEASTASALAYRAGEGLLSPPLGKVLRGISMGVVIELTQRLGIPFQQRDLRPEDFATADEAMLTSTSGCLVPVTRFNGRAVGQGSPGPVFQRIVEAWKELVGFDFTEQARRFAERA